MDGGTIYQLRNLINRRNIVKNPVDAVDACEDIVLVTEAHILSAAMTLFGMKNLDDHPTEEYFPENRKNSVLCSEGIYLTLLPNIWLMNLWTTIPVEKPGNNDPSSKTPAPKNVDCVFSYACDLLNNGLQLMEVNDANREGDGNRIVRCWQYMFLIFKATIALITQLRHLPCLCSSLTFSHHVWFNS